MKPVNGTIITALFCVALLSLGAPSSSAQTQLNFDNEILRGDRDSGFLPGVRLDGGSDRDDGRIRRRRDEARDVTRWETDGRRGRSISREVWVDSSGQQRGRFAIGRPF